MLRKTLLLLSGLAVLFFSPVHSNAEKLTSKKLINSCESLSEILNEEKKPFGFIYDVSPADAMRAGLCLGVLKQSIYPKDPSREFFGRWAELIANYHAVSDNYMDMLEETYKGAR